MPINSTTTPDQLVREFVISRTFDAPRHLVFRAFTKAESLARWWGPRGFSIEVAHFEFRPGGAFHYQMVDPSGHDMWGRFVYREIVEPERIVLVNSFSDPAGNLARAPFSPTFPLEMLLAFTLSEQNGKTTLTLRGSAVDVTAEERATFEGMFDSMQEGFGNSWDQLAALLAQEQAAA
jgi:uncharacterized protein YndB with AHSA1/START domain